MHWESPLVFTHQAVLANRLIFVLDCPAKGRKQWKAQAFTGHFRNLDAEPALGRFQVFSGAPVHVDDFMVLIDDDAGRRVIFQQLPPPPGPGFQISVVRGAVSDSLIEFSFLSALAEVGNSTCGRTKFSFF
jgi:hypothetical protein